MAQKCKFPNCHQPATKIWALVPLCPFHYEGLVEETEWYYNGNSSTKISDRSRKIYQEIKQFTPWGKEVEK